MTTPTAAPSSATPASEPRDRVLTILDFEPHRAFTVEEMIKAITPAALKDPDKKKAAVEEMTARLTKLVEAREAVHIGDGLYKYRLFLDKEDKNIEHAFLGGMGNTFYRFRSTVFRLNIGVLSLYFIRDKKAKDWVVTVRDTTIGRDYGLIHRLKDGTYTLGKRQPKAGEERFIQIEGKYIEKDHVTVSLSGEDVKVEDLKTINGSRVDLLSPEGLTKYEAVAEEFLKSATPQGRRDQLTRGRFALSKLIEAHQNFESSFFGAVVDTILMEKSA